MNNRDGPVWEIETPHLNMDTSGSPNPDGIGALSISNTLGGDNLTAITLLTPVSVATSSASCGGSSMAMGAAADRKLNGKSPTCKVCGDESSGFHYGVNSCEGCKGFFRRCITQGMTHKCSNEEKCDITPFTRNSCQYCRLKKCFTVGMSREASRLGRRPKRLKDSSGEPKQSHTNLPIAPYPSPAELYNLRMAELQRLLQQNGTFKSDLMQKFLSAAKVSFQEHQRQGNNNQKGKPGPGQKEGPEERGFTSPTSNTSPSSLTDLGSTNNRNVNNKLIDNKEGIYETIDNYQYSQDANVIKMDNETGTNTQLYTDVKQDQFLPETNVIKMDNETGGNSPLYTEIKQEPDLDNKTLSMMSDYSTSTLSSLEASPLIMPDMSPDTLMDNNNMMEGMMGGLMGGMMEGMMSGKMPEMPPMMPGMTFPEPDPNANEIDVDRIMEEVKQVPSDLRRDLMEQVIETVGNAHMQTVRPTYKSIAEANQRLEQMIAEGNMPDMAKLSLNPTVMWQEFIQSMVLEITNVVRFCKKLPGFGEIAQDDQIIMIKKGAFEVLVVRMCMLVDHLKGEMFDPNMKMKCPRAMVKGMPMGFFMEEFFSVAEQLNPLEMTDKERGMFSAMLMMCPDREGLSNKIAIEKLNSLFNQSMFVMMKRQHADYENKFARLVGIIPLFHAINKKHSMALNSMRMQKAEVIKEMPQLTKEVWDIETEEN